MATIDVRELEETLGRGQGGEVRFDSASLAMYASDASNFRQVPIGVVVPRTLDDVVATHEICSAFEAPVVNRGGGTSLSGETVNYAVVVDNSKYLNAIGDPDTEHCTVTVQPGAVNEHVNLRTGPAGLVFGPDPSSHSRCTIGGNIGNNSCGAHSVQSQLYGPGPRTSDNVARLEICTYEGARFWVGVDEEKDLEAIIAAGGRKGDLYRRLRDLRDKYASAIRAGYPDLKALPRRVSGYNLDELLPERGFNVARALTGTESTCATVLQATLLLTPALPRRVTVVAAYKDIAQAGDAVQEIMEQFSPIALEGLDRRLIEDQSHLGLNISKLRELPQSEQAGGWLMVQFGSGSLEEAQAQAKSFTAWLASQGYRDDTFGIAKSRAEGGYAEDLWEIREAGLAATAFPPGERDHWPGWEDSAVPPPKVGAYLRDLSALYRDYGLRGAMYGHFGQGCIHSRISFDLRSAAGVKGYRSFMESAADLVVSYGGSLSGEHGDGQQRAELLAKQYGPELLQAMSEFKLAWDPTWRMNPGKVVEPYPLDKDLKLGTSYNPRRPKVKFAYKPDGGDFAHATLRCVGVGKCRATGGTQVMCPSYQVTMEEKHSTRGRARLLFEMLQGDIVKDGWRSLEVKEALDLCLSCKGCTNDCPVNVDMPTYKAEFLYHHYKSPRRRRPRHAYALGFIGQSSRLASALPELANTATQTPGLSRLTKAVAGIDRRRALPKFAPVTLQNWFFSPHGLPEAGGPEMVLFPDTFNNRLHTQVGVACVEAIEAAGWRVVLPKGHICCGRPFYDYGFLDSAKGYLEHLVDLLRPYARAGTPVVGIEPSCLAVFRDELGKLLPHDDDAKRLKDCAMHFAEFFERYQLDVPQLHRPAMLWGHCHQHATGGLDADRRLLERMGMEVREVSGGCCGLAGSWGFEDGKYDISLACGEQALLPAVREASPETIVVANGFSCKTQVAQAVQGRRALHLAEVMYLARHGSEPPLPVAGLGKRMARSTVPLALGVAGAAAAILRRR
ncbi:MAG: FAD-binding and (Fe-S)-binding domain-containing protein [Actinomycetota bacterium]|nr:FAD-binding and (Fe-S)-binding domain-containing protein [Actinomycetota bacterium]